jgi:hypothetical protein
MIDEKTMSSQCWIQLLSFDVDHPAPSSMLSIAPYQPEAAAADAHV